MKLIIALVFTTLMSGCNMVAGAGKDITNSSDWVKNKLNSGGGKAAPQKTSPDTQPAPAKPDTPVMPSAPASQTNT